MTELPLVGDEFAGYRVRSVLGRGGMSVVYQAENLRLSSVIALKMLAPGLAAESIPTVFNTLWAYDLAGSTWSILPNLAAPRHGAGCRDDRQHPPSTAHPSPDTMHPLPPYKPSLFTTREISRP
jgi:serine/threonine protein kinase